MSSTEHSEPGVLDLERALSRLAGDEEMFGELAEIFLRESPRWMALLEKSVADEDAAGVFRAAHDLKGSTDVFCAAAAVKAAQHMEKMGREEQLAGADEALGALKAEIVWVRNELRDYLKR